MLRGEEDRQAMLMPVHDLVVKGLHFHAHTRDPDSPDYTGNAAGGPPQIGFYVDGAQYRTVGTPTDFGATGATVARIDLPTDHDEQLAAYRQTDIAVRATTDPVCGGMDGYGLFESIAESLS